MYTCENIPFSVLHRVRRCCSTDTSFQEGVQEYKTHLLNRDYDEKIIDNAIDRVNALDRNDLLAKKVSKVKSNKQNFPLVMKYNVKLPNMSKILKKHQHILEYSSATAELFPDKSIFVSYKVEKSIRDQITSSKFKSTEHSVENTLSGNKEVISQGTVPGNKMGCKKCNKCKLCKLYLSESEVAWSHHTGEKFKIQTLLTCDTQNVIYALHDKICKLTYIGYTEDNMKIRWSNHKSHIKQWHKTCKVATHFINESKAQHELNRQSLKIFDAQLVDHIEVVLIEQVNVPSNVTGKAKTRLLEIRESHWQHKLKAVSLFGGLNERNIIKHK